MEMVAMPEYFEDTFHHQGALKEINLNEGQDFKDFNFPGVHILNEPKDIMSTKDVGSPGSRKLRMQRCSVDGCKEMVYKTRASRSWVCRQHQSKLQKEMLKKRLEERCRTPVSTEQVQPKIEPLVRNPGGGGDPQQPRTDLLSSLRPSLLEEVLNEKKLGLMRSPEVVRFLRREQKVVETKKKEEQSQLPTSTSTTITIKTERPSPAFGAPSQSHR